MKFLAIFRFEFGYQIRRIWPWLIFVVLVVLTFLMTRDTAVSDALYEDFLANSPFQIAITTVIGTLIWLLMAVPVAGDAAARDETTGMYPLIYTTAITKIEYIGGRFISAFALNALILLAVQLGILLGIYLPGANARVIGPFRPEAFLTAFVFISLVNAFVATAIQFFLSGRTGRTMAGFLGSVFLVFMGFFVATILNFFVKQGLGSLLDPIGINFIVQDLAHSWTTIERNSRLLSLEGPLLSNRLVWSSAGLAVLAFTFVSFRFAHRTTTGWWSRILRRRGMHSPAPTVIGVTARAAISIPQVTRTFGLAFDVRQTLAIAWTSFRSLARSWAGLGMLVPIPLLTVIVLLDQMATFGNPLVPTTARVLAELTGGMSAELSAEPNRWVIVPLLIVFFAGELVWREREAGLGEITGTLPGSEWAPFLGKFLGLGLMLAAFLVALSAAGMLAQVLMDYQNFEIGLYFTILFGLQLPEYLLFAVVALAVHVLIDHKYIGHLVAILVYGYIAVIAGMLGIEHNLLVYGASPSWLYNEIRGFGPFLGPWLWFKLYWAAWAGVVAVVARLLWVRGKEKHIGVRFAEARRRFTRPTALVSAVAGILVLTLGGFIFYNTNILNRYLNSSDITERRAEYERRYGKYENIPQPHLAATNLHIEIYPERGAVDIRGSYRLVNGSAVPIDSIHVATSMGGAETGDLSFDREATLIIDDKEHAYRVYDLDSPLQPGDSLQLNFEVHIERRGFRNHGIDRSVVDNGSYFNNMMWFPSIGYQWSRALLSPADRRAHGLEQRPLLASLYDTDACETPALREGINFEAVIGTDEDEVAVAPGALRRTWTEGGRRYFHYSTDAPIGTEWAFFSSNYAVQEGLWTDTSDSSRVVAVSIFHHLGHTAHVEGMMQCVRASLDYYTRQFGPAYPYSHLTVVESPVATGTGAHADASMISHGQGFSDWITKDEIRSLDLPYFVVAHEMGHQWGLPLALVEGLPFMAEGLATYFAMQVVKETRGEEQFRRLMSFMRQPFPYRPIHRGEPLLRALDPYLSRRKGPFALLALGEYMGSDRVNDALRKLYDSRDSAGSPAVTTLDLYRELQAVTPDTLQQMLHDLFEVNAYWQFRTEKVTAQQNADSSWQVTLDVHARKVVFDSAGAATETPLDEWVEVGVFGEPDSRGELSEPLHLEKHRIRSGEQTITITVPGKPVFSGIDPRHLLDWEEGEEDDNIEVVTFENQEL